VARIALIITRNTQVPSKNKPASSGELEAFREVRPNCLILGDAGVRRADRGPPFFWVCPLRHAALEVQVLHAPGTGDTLVVPPVNPDHISGALAIAGWEHFGGGGAPVVELQPE